MSIFKFKTELSKLQRFSVEHTANDVELADKIIAYTQGKLLEQAGKALSKKPDEYIKTKFAGALVEPKSRELLSRAAGIKLFVQVDNPRETFDKAAFIKKVSKEFNVSASQLAAIATTTVKKTKPIVKLSFELENESE